MLFKDRTELSMSSKCVYIREEVNSLLRIMLCYEIKIFTFAIVNNEQIDNKTQQMKVCAKFNSCFLEVKLCSSFLAIVGATSLVLFFLTVLV